MTERLHAVPHDAEIEAMLVQRAGSGMPPIVASRILKQVAVTRQRPATPRLRSPLARRSRALLLAAAVGVGALGGGLVFVGGSARPAVGPADPTQSSASSGIASQAVSPAWRSPKAPLRLPGFAPAPAGVYGWEGGPGSNAGMHKQGTDLIFAVDCLWGEQPQARRVRIAGLDGMVVEPYEPPRVFGSRDGDEVTRAHALAVGDRTLCVFLTWDSSTTEDELEAAERVLDTIDAEPIGEKLVRVYFTLGGGWDRG